MKFCILIPVFNHRQVLAAMLAELEVYGLPCLLIDDGSDLECQQEILRLAQNNSWIESDRLECNQGKGAAVIRGLQIAHQRGYSHALQLDADWQHNLNDIPAFLEKATHHPQSLILGVAQYDESVPKSRLYGRYITHFWVWIETLSFKIRDSMCGFRVYPIKSTLHVCNNHSVGKRMDFDIEVVVKMNWAGIDTQSIPTLVRYAQDGISHFDILHDNIRISTMHSKLFLGMLLRIPALILHKFGVKKLKLTDEADG